jgi:hypothetical protein
MINNGQGETGDPSPEWSLLPHPVLFDVASRCAPHITAEAADRPLRFSETAGAVGRAENLSHFRTDTPSGLCACSGYCRIYSCFALKTPAFKGV